MEKTAAWAAAVFLVSIKPVNIPRETARCQAMANIDGQTKG